MRPEIFVTDREVIDAQHGGNPENGSGCPCAENGLQAMAAASRKDAKSKGFLGADHHFPHET